MRGLLILAMFAGTLTHAAWNDYVEVRDLVLDAGGIETLDIDAGAGSLTVRGRSGAERITVTATINVPGGDEEKARKRIERDMTLKLDRAGDRAVLEAYFDPGLPGWGDQPSIALDVELPRRLGLVVDDGSGSIDIAAIDGPVQIDDGSGSLELTDAGSSVEIDDGSGSIQVRNAGGDVRITDGSGSVTVVRVAGSVYIDDGSGSIAVDEVAHDLIIEEAGSGGVRYHNVLGEVVLDE
jgi:hypothetical protein